MDVYSRLKKEFAKLAEKYSLMADPIGVTAKALTPDEVIGNPEEKDFPLVKGRERMMDAAFRGAHGQAFSDMYGDWKGDVKDLLEMNLTNNFRRAVFVASINAVMRALGLVGQTVHCRDSDPRTCGKQCRDRFLAEFNPSTITMIGYQPRMFEQLRKKIMVYVVDLDEDNVGRVIDGTKIVGIDQTDKAVEKAEVLLVTGSALVNNTIERFLHLDKPTVFYGVTIAGAAELLGLERYCPMGV